MKTKQILFALVISSLSINASAQVPQMVTLNNGGTVPCDHPLAIAENKTCEVKQAALITDCRTNFDPYTNPEAALACWKEKYTGTLDDGWRFKIGKTYVHPYDEMTVTIIGLLVNTKGASVFVAEDKRGSLWQFPSNDNPKSHAFYQEQ